MAREMLFAPELLFVVEAESVALAPVSRPLIAAVINRDFIVALVISGIPFEGLLSLSVSGFR